MDQKERWRQNAKENRRRRRKIVLERYGTACVWCGFDDERALQIDHIDDSGAEQRKEKGRSFSGGWFYQHLIKLGLPDGYQTLCANCNTIKEYEKRQLKKDS